MVRVTIIIHYTQLDFSYYTLKYNYYNHCKSIASSFASLNLYLRKFTPKFLTSQSVLLKVTTCPVSNPITNPQAYPITTTFQPNPSPNDDSCLISELGISLFPHFLDN